MVENITEKIFEASEFFRHAWRKGKIKRGTCSDKPNKKMGKQVQEILTYIGSELFLGAICVAYDFKFGVVVLSFAVACQLLKLLTIAVKASQENKSREKKPFDLAGSFILPSSTVASQKIETKKSENLVSESKVETVMQTQSASETVNKSQQAPQLDQSTADTNETSADVTNAERASCLEGEPEDLEITLSKITKVDNSISRNFLGVRSMTRSTKGAKKEKEAPKDCAVIPVTPARTKESVVIVPPAKQKGKVSLYAIGVAGFRVTAPDYGLLLLYDVPTYTTKIRRRHKGANTGFNIRLAKGLHWRIGGNQGVSENFEEDIALGTCTLLITNRYIFIRTTNGRVRRYLRSNVVGYEFYRDGVSLNMQNGTPLTFVASSSEIDEIIDAALFEEET